MKTATNPSTGQRVYLDEVSGQWLPLRTATNKETGQKLYETAGGWQPLGLSGLDLAEAQMAEMNGPQVERAADEPKRERSVVESFAGAFDAAGTIISEALAGGVGGTLGVIEGGVETAINGTYGTPEGIAQIQDTMQQRGDILRRPPTTEAGTEQLAALGEVMEPLTRSDQLGPLAAAIPTAPVSIAPNAISAAGRAAGNAAETAIKALPSRGKNAPDTGVGAAEVDEVALMMANAREFGFEGETGPTVGQATRDPEQLRFENEAAKDPEGRALETRRANQQQRLGEVFEEMEDEAAPGIRYGDDDDQGRAVQAALEARKAERKKERDALYAKAKAAGEMEEEIDIPRLPTAFAQLKKMEDAVPANAVVLKVAQKNGLIDADGNPLPTTIQTIESFRDFVNLAYKYEDPRERMQRGILMAALDAGLDGSPSGKMYKAARANASDFRNEFFNSPLARDMTSNKTNANVPKVDPGKVFQKVQRGSIEEIKQLEKTLSATTEGQQVWMGLQARMIDELRRKAFGTQQDSNRNPLATPAVFRREIEKLSKSGKLTAILGKENAGKMLDLSKLMSDLMTSPPGTANHSSTMMAMRQWVRSAPARFGKLIPLIETSIKQAESMKKEKQVKKALDSSGLLGALK